MSLKRLDPEDFLISTDSIVAPAFSNGSNTSTGATATNSGLSSNYYTAYQGQDGKIDYSVAEFDKDAADNEIEKKVIYYQLKNIIKGTSDELPITSGAVVAIERARFKQSVFPSTFDFNGIRPKTGSVDISYTEAGRQFPMASGGHYFYPDVGLLLEDGGSDAAKTIKADSEEVITSNYVFIRARNSEFNYSTNPSFRDSTTGGVLYTDFITAPQTFITAVGLYNDNGDLLAVAKLSKPLKKDFTKEALIRIKLDF